jgi:D-alanyl-D-alanine dipeptidase
MKTATCLVKKTLVSAAAIIVLDMSAALVDVQSINPRIKVDLMYARADNFTAKVLYPTYARAYLLEEVAHALSAAQDELDVLGYGLLICDAYRPLSEQWNLWNVVPDKRYVSHPEEQAVHTRGAAVDVTLVHKLTGECVEMPSAVDDFTEKAWISYQGASADALKHRELLAGIMQKHGFERIKYEWWHFNYHTWRTCNKLDVSFEMLSKK